MVRVFCQWLKTNSIVLINAGSLIGTSGVTSILGFVYWWFAARHFAPDVVGLANAIISAMTLLGTLATLGFGTLLLRELPVHRGKEASLISATLILVGTVGGCLGIGYAFLAPYLATAFEVLEASIVNSVLFASGVSLTAITLVLDRALIGLLRGEQQLWRNTLFAATKLIALFAVGFWFSHSTGLTIYATWTIGNLCSLAVLAGFVVVKRGGVGRSYRPRWGLLRKLGTAALKHHALNIAIDAPFLILPVLITVILSARANAWFYVAWTLASVANTVSVALATTLYAVSATQPSTLAHKLKMTLGLALIACMLINVILLFGTKQVLDLFGHGYSEQATWSLRILSVESFPFIVKNYYNILSRIYNRIGYTTLLTIATGLLELGVSTVGARLGGLNGLSLGWLSAMCIEAAYMFPTIYRALRSADPFPQTSAKQNVLEKEALWLIDTLVLTAIRPETMYTSVNTCQSSEQRIESESISYPSHRWTHLRPTRLEPLLSDDEESVNPYQESEVGPLKGENNDARINQNQPRSFRYYPE